MRTTLLFLERCRTAALAAFSALVVRAECLLIWCLEAARRKTDGISVRRGRSAALATIGATLAALVTWAVWSAMSDPVATAANFRTLMDAQTCRLVEVRVDENLGPFPVVNPKTGRRTLYPTEVCYAKPCAARGGTHAILNAYLGKEGPTHCTACGAEVRFHNGGPGAGPGQPPTEGW